MNKQYKQMLLSIIICSMLVACDNQQINSDIDKNAIENMGIEYSINKDGTYSCQGGTYKYKLTLTGKHNGATKEGKITVLTNNKDLQYEDVFNSLISSQLEVGEPKFVILGME